MITTNAKDTTKVYMNRLQQQDSRANGLVNKGARHVMLMAIGGKLVDGTKGGYDTRVTGAQYANAAYRVDDKWHHNAEIMKGGGTVRAS